MFSGCTEQSLRSTCAPILRHTDLGTTHDGPLEASVWESRRPARRRRQGGAGPARHWSCSPCGRHIHAPLNLLTYSAQSLLCRGAFGGRAYARGTVSPPHSDQSQRTAVPRRQDKKKVQRTRDLSLCTAGTRQLPERRQSPAGEPRELATPAEGEWGHSGVQGAVGPPTGSSETGHIPSARRPDTG